MPLIFFVLVYWWTNIITKEMQNKRFSIFVSLRLKWIVSSLTKKTLVVWSVFVIQAWKIIRPWALLMILFGFLQVLIQGKDISPSSWGFGANKAKSWKDLNVMQNRVFNHKSTIPVILFRIISQCTIVFPQNLGNLGHHHIHILTWNCSKINHYYDQESNSQGKQTLWY